MTHEDTHIFFWIQRERKKKIIVDNFYFLAPLSLALALTYSACVTNIILVYPKYALYTTLYQMWSWVVVHRSKLTSSSSWLPKSACNTTKKLLAVFRLFSFVWFFFAILFFRALFNFYILLSLFYFLRLLSWHFLENSRSHDEKKYERFNH